jgi:hypothetical protein
MSVLKVTIKKSWIDDRKKSCYLSKEIHYHHLNLTRQVALVSSISLTRISPHRAKELIENIGGNNA